MIYILLFFALFYFFTFYFSVSKRGLLHPYSVLVFLILLISVTSLFTNIKDYKFLILSSHSLFYYCLFFLLWFIIIQPIKNVRPIKKFKLNLHYFRLLVNITGIISFIPFIYLSSYAFIGLLSGAAAVRIDLYINKLYILPDSLLTTFSAGLSMFYPLIMIFYFLSDNIKFFKFIKIGIFLGAFINPILLALCFMERDIFIFLPVLILFNLYITDRKINLNFNNFSLLISFLFFGILMSVSRFGEEGLDRLLFGTIGYFGQQPYVFVDILTNHTDFYGLSLRLPVISELLGNYREIIRVNPREWHFGSIFADFYMMYSWNSLFIGFATLFAIINFVNFKRINSFSSLFSATLIFQILSQGIFYFNLGNSPGNQYLIISVLLILIFKITKL